MRQRDSVQFSAATLLCSHFGSLGCVQYTNAPKVYFSAVLCIVLRSIAWGRNIAAQSISLWGLNTLSFCIFVGEHLPRPWVSIWHVRAEAVAHTRRSVHQQPVAEWGAASHARGAERESRTAFLSDTASINKSAGKVYCWLHHPSLLKDNYIMADSPDAPSNEHVKPREVPYCGFCSLPPEYCEFGPTLDK